MFMSEIMQAFGKGLVVSVAVFLLAASALSAYAYLSNGLGGIMCGSWSGSTPGVSYDANCTKGWQAYTEDNYASYNPQINWTVINATEYGIDGIYLKTSKTGLGNLWAYKTLYVSPNTSNITINAVYRMTKKTTAGSPVGGGIYVWNGTVKPCFSWRETGACGAGNTSYAIAFDSTTCDLSGWCSLHYSTLNINNSVLKASSLTVGFLIGDGWIAHTCYMDIVNLTVSVSY